MARPIVVQITGDSKGFVDATKQASEHGAKFGGVMQGLAAGLGLGLFNKATDAISELTRKVLESGVVFREDQTSVALLTQALDDNLKSYDIGLPAIAQFVDEQAGVGYGAVEVRNALGQLVGVTHDVGGAINDLSLAEDFARAHHLDLASAVDIVSKVSAGNARALKTYGISIPAVTAAVDALHASHKKITHAQLAHAQATDKAATAAAALKAMYDQTKGAADAYANTSEGKLATAQAQNTASWVKIGAIVDRVQSVILPLVANAFSRVADAIQPTIDAVTQFLNKNQLMQPVLYGVAAALGVIAIAAGIMAVEMIVAFLPIILIIGVIVAAVAVFKYAWDHNFMGMRDTLKQVWSEVQPVFNTIKDWVMVHLPGALSWLGNAAKIAVAVIVTAFMVWWQITGTVVHAVITFVQGIGPWFSWLGTTANNMKNTVVSAFNSVVSTVAGIPAKVTTAASGMWDGIKSAFKSALNWIIDKWNGLSFKIPSFDFLGQHTPGVTLSVPHIQRFHQGGIVQGSPGSDVLIMAQAGERVSKAGAGAPSVYIHVEHWYGSEGADLDRFANKIAQRLRFAPGT